MSTVLYTDVRYNGSHFESMVRQSQQIKTALTNTTAYVVRYFRNRAAKKYLRTMPEYLLEDIGVTRAQLY